MPRTPSGSWTRLPVVKAAGIGLGQALALVPGTSRSGITISVGLFQGVSREAAARFSFLLSIPAILGAGILKLDELSRATEARPSWPPAPPPPCPASWPCRS